MTFRPVIGRPNGWARKVGPFNNVTMAHGMVANGSAGLQVEIARGTERAKPGVAGNDVQTIRLCHHGGNFPAPRLAWAGIFFGGTTIRTRLCSHAAACRAEKGTALMDYAMCPAWAPGFGLRECPIRRRWHGHANRKPRATRSRSVLGTEWHGWRLSAASNAGRPFESDRRRSSECPKSVIEICTETGVSGTTVSRVYQGTRDSGGA